jgi:hypothetical protein
MPYYSLVICNTENTICNLFPDAAVAFITSPSVITRGCVNNSTVALAEIALVLNKLNTLDDASVSVKVILSALPESSDTNIDLIILVVAVVDVPAAGLV